LAEAIDMCQQAIHSTSMLPD